MKTNIYFNREEKIALKALFQEKFCYTFRSPYLLAQAFRRQSFAAENGRKGNEIFEFIGDQVLSTYVVKAVAERCGSRGIDGDYSFLIRENRFSSIRQALVKNETLAAIVDEWGLIDFLRISKSDEKNNIRQETKVKADLFEAILGAIAVDCNWDSSVLETAVNHGLGLAEKLNTLINSEHPIFIDFDLDSAVSRAKELAEQGHFTMPEYSFSGPEHLDYDKDGNPIWFCQCTVINDQTGIVCGVFASSKKDAKKAAAYLVLCRHFNVQNKYGVNSFVPVWRYDNGKLLPETASDISKKLLG